MAPTPPEDAGHDPVIKQVLQTFIGEFFDLFYPDIAARLDFATVKWLDKEVFTDPPGGNQRTADLVAQVHTKTGQPEILLLHIEPQRRRDKEFPRRVFEYWFLLRQRYDFAVLPVAVYLSPGAGGIVSEKYDETLFGEIQLTFRYRAVGLPDLLASEYEERDNPLALGFSAMMREQKRYSRAKGTGNVTRRLRLLRRLVKTDLDTNRQAYLYALVEKYLPLTQAERIEYNNRIKALEETNVEAVMTEWQRENYEKGLSQGLSQGLTQGAVENARQNLLLVLETRFGAVPPAVRDRITSLPDVTELQRLLRVAVVAPSLDVWEQG